MFYKNQACLAVLFIIVLLNEISYQMVIPPMGALLEFLQPAASVDAVNKLYGTGIALFTATLMLGAPLMGYLSDRYGRKRVILLCLAFIFISCLFYMLAFYFKNLWLFLSGRFLSGLGGSSIAIIQACLSDLSRHNIQKRSAHFSAMGLALTLGLVIGPLLSSFFIKTQPITALKLALPFIIMASVCFFNGVLFSFVFQSSPSSLLQSPSKHYFFKKELFKLLSNKTIASGLIVFFILEFSWSLYYLTLPLALKKKLAYEPYAIGFFMSMAGLSLCVNLALYTVSLRFFILKTSLKKLLFFTFFVFIFCELLLEGKPSEGFYKITLYPITWAVAFSYTGVMTMLSQHTSKNHQGILMGLTLTTMAVAWTLTGFSVKLLFYKHSGSHLPFLISLSTLIVGLLFIYISDFKEKAID